MSLPTLKQVFSLKTQPRRLTVIFQIIEKIGSNIYKIRDKDDCPYQLDISGAKHYMTRYFENGKFLKVINPRIDKKSSTLHIEQKTIVSRGNEIPGLENLQTFQTIQSTFLLEPNVVVPGKILGKVVRLHEPEEHNTIYGKRVKYSCEIKDIIGNRQVVTFWRWPNSKLCVQLMKAYVFIKLQTERFPENKPHFLEARRDENVVLASDEMQTQMRLIENADKKIEGKILAIHSSMKYISCPSCKRAIKKAGFKSGDNCQRPGCKKKVDIAVKDFSFVAVLENGRFDDISVTCFKEQFPIDLSYTNLEELETAIITKYEGQTVKADIIKKKHPDNDVLWRVLEVTIASGK